MTIKQGNQNPAQDAGDEVYLQEYIDVLYRRRKLGLITFGIVAGLIVLYTIIARPLYEATATLHVQDEKLKGGDILGDLGLSRENPIETEVEIIKSRTNAEEVVRRLQLHWELQDVPEGVTFSLLEFSSEDDEGEYKIVMTGDGRYTIRGSSWSKAAEGQAGKLLVHEDLKLLIDQLKGPADARFNLVLHPFNKVVNELRDQIGANEVGKGTNIIRLAYRNSDPVLASDVVNTLATVYLDRNVLLKTEEARKSVEFIEQQLDEVRRLLDTAEQSLQDYKRQSGVIRFDSEAQTLISRLAQADTDRTAARLGSQQAKYAITALEKALRDGLSYAPSTLLDDPVLAELARELARLEVERKGLLGQFTEAHPAVKVIDERLIGIHDKMLRTYRGLKRGFDSRIVDLGKEILRFETELKTLPEAEQQLARLTRLATVNADIYTFLLQKHEEARIARAATISSINVIDPAIVPDVPVKPNVKVNLLLAVILGGMSCLVAVFFREYLDDTIKDAESAKRLFNAGLLAVIPHIEFEDDSEAKRTLISHLEPRSAAAEAFRTMRTALHFAASTQKNKIILVTSSFSGEGKTTVSANLAETIAKTGASVLVVGCDLRRPTLHRIFEVPSTPGLSEVLIGDEALGSVIRGTGIERLDFISSGIVPPNPAELLGSEAMKSVVEELSAQFDYVILDAPPLLAVTDASLLSEYADLMVVVVEVGRVQHRAAMRMRELLTPLQAPVAGVVLNDKTGKGLEYYSYYRSRYGRYGYGQYGYYSSGYYDEADRKLSSSASKRLSLLERLFKSRKSK